jgi:RNA polymerase sigma-70 factor (ECF subfamily)
MGEDVDAVDHLVERARRGDPEAFGDLYDRFHGRVFRYFQARIGDRDEAEDMAAEVFVEAAQRIRTFRGTAAGFVGWLFAMARHDLFDRWRRERRLIVEPVPDVPETDRAPDPADGVADRLDAGRVRAAMEELTPDQREVLVLKFAAGLSNLEVAEALGKPVSAVKSLQHRGLGALRRILDDEGPCG